VCLPQGWGWIAGGLFLVLLAGGCATSKIDWNSRIGHYTYDQAIVDLGPPDKSAKLADGTVVADWLLQRGGSVGSLQSFPSLSVQYYQITPSPDWFIRLVFDAHGLLQEWKRFLR
jgi:hypothetical protein